VVAALHQTNRPARQPASKCGRPGDQLPPELCALPSGCALGERLVGSHDLHQASFDERRLGAIGHKTGGLIGSLMPLGATLPPLGRLSWPHD
jgi:hypothetical protein